jgi:Ni,Fe-hydrogenase I large subunit
MSRVVVDPVTRIEGHLRIEAEVDGGSVKDAWSSSTMFRGIEIILKGRDPRDAWAFTQRICGVCTTVHAIASIRAVENAIGAAPPPNARLLRNLIIGAQCVQDHVIHFYHLHALDWVDIVSALSADPAKTATLAQSISDWPLSSPKYFAGVRDRIKAFVDRGQLGPFANAYWGHPAYRLPPEANLMAVAHYLEALDWQREFIKMHAVLGGKNPHLQSFLVGGMATPIDPDKQASINAGTIAQLQELIAKARDFVARVYIPDLLAVASFYKDWAGHCRGVGNYLVYGEYPDDDNPNPNLFLPRGIIRGRDLSKVEPFDHMKVTEYVSHSWYQYERGDAVALHPFDGETQPNYTGPTPPYEFLGLEPDTTKKYSWLKSPRYDGQPMEVGPLARMLVAYASGHPRVKELVGSVLKQLNVGPEALFSTLGRIAARGIETLVIAEKMSDWVNGLAANMASGELRIHDNSKWEPATWPADATGAGFHEAPRGALGHWVHIHDGTIANYQCVVPSTWNAGPRDAMGRRGPYEEALIATPVADPQRPIEILRTVHSFDPCMACGVHVVDAQRYELARVRAV